jgi:hypothetical protein
VNVTSRFLHAPYLLAQPENNYLLKIANRNSPSRARKMIANGGASFFQNSRHCGVIQTPSQIVIQASSAATLLHQTSSQLARQDFKT